MASFPINMENTLVNFESRDIKPANRQTSSSGYTISFSKGTIIKKGFNFSLDYLSQTDKETLETFFDDNQGISFEIDFTCTGDTTVYNVVFDQNEITFKYLKRFPNSQYYIELRVREV